MLFLTWISKLVPLLPGSPERQIAHFHTLFNIGVTVLFFPLLPYVAKLFHRLFPQAEEGPTFEVNLDDRLLDIPAIGRASCRVKRKVSGVGDSVQRVCVV